MFQNMSHKVYSPFIDFSNQIYTHTTTSEETYTATQPCAIQYSMTSYVGYSAVGGNNQTLYAYVNNNIIARTRTIIGGSGTNDIVIGTGISGIAYLDKGDIFKIQGSTDYGSLYTVYGLK